VHLQALLTHQRRSQSVRARHITTLNISTLEALFICDDASHKLTFTLHLHYMLCQASHSSF